VLFVLCVSVYLPGATRDGVQANDTRGAAVAAYLFVETGSLAFPQSWPQEHAFWATERADGRLSVNRMPGVILTGIPAYAVARLAGVTPRLDTVTHPVFVPFAPAAYAALTVTAAALALLFLVFVRLVGNKDAFVAAAVIAFTTPFFSVAADALWPHATTALALGLLLIAEDKPRLLAASGAALAVFTRPHLAVVPVVMALLQRKDVRSVAALGVGVSVGIGALVWYSVAVFGMWLPAAGYDTGGFLSRLVSASPYATAENMVQALLNIDRGILLHTPYVAVLFPAIVVAWRDAPAFTKRAAIAGLIYFVLQMRMARFSGGGGFAQWRTSLETLVLFAPLGIYASVHVVRQYRLWRALLWVSVAVAFGMTVWGVIDGGRSEWAHQWWAQQQQLHR